MSVTTNLVEDKKSKIARLRTKHQPVFDAMGIPDAVYIPKMAYTPRGKDEKHLGFFPSELRKGEDIYTEFVSAENDPEDPDRTLYRLRHNPHWETEYETTSKPGDATVRYLIPIAELTKVEGVQPSKKLDKDELSLVDPELDPPYNTMTLRDYAAIQLGVPESNKQWLNDMIRKSKRK